MLTYEAILLVSHIASVAIPSFVMLPYGLCDSIASIFISERVGLHHDAHEITKVLNCSH